METLIVIVRRLHSNSKKKNQNTYHRLLANSILWTKLSLAVPTANLSNDVAVNSIRKATLIHCWESFVDSTEMRDRENKMI